MMNQWEEGQAKEVSHTFDKVYCYHLVDHMAVDLVEHEGVFQTPPPAPEDSVWGDALYFKIRARLEYLNKFININTPA